MLRVALIGYGKWQDGNMDVNYTDIDYAVYSDAAGFMNQGLSPYERATYRYTPLLAGILLPNCVVAEYGKILFSVGDILAARWVSLWFTSTYVASSLLRMIIYYTRCYGRQNPGGNKSNLSLFLFFFISA